MKRQLRLAIPLALIAVVGVVAAQLIASPDGFTQDLQDLASTDLPTRSEAVTRLKDSTASDMTASLLVELRSDHAASTKAGIVEVLRHRTLGSSHASLLNQALVSEDAMVRQMGIAIADSSPTLASSNLLRIAEDKHELVHLRAAAARAVGAIGGDARGRLKALASEPDLSLSLRTAVLAGLASTTDDGAIDVRRVAEDTTDSIEVRLAAVGALATPKSKGHAQLITLAGNSDARIRARAAQMLALTPGVGSAATLTGLLNNAAADVRLAALRSLIALGHENAQQIPIATRLADGDARVQALAAESIGRSSANRAGAVNAALRGLLASGNFNVRYAAALALNSHGDKFGLATMQADSLAAAAPAAQRIKALKAVSIINPPQK